jgi:quercetin dioxygenase-like cupin family protein
VPVAVEPFVRPNWEPLPMEGCRNVAGRVVFRDETLLISVLRFDENGTIHEHAGASDAIVACLEGSGYTSVGDELAPIAEGQRVTWPKGVRHRLWTEDSAMMTLMVERITRSG